MAYQPHRVHIWDKHIFELEDSKKYTVKRGSKYYIIIEGPSTRLEGETDAESLFLGGIDSKISIEELRRKREITLTIMEYTAVSLLENKLKAAFAGRKISEKDSFQDEGKRGLVEIIQEPTIGSLLTMGIYYSNRGIVRVITPLSPIKNIQKL